MCGVLLQPDTLLSNTYSNDCWRMYVYDAFNVWSCAMDGRVQHETSNIDAKISCARFHYAALHINLDQRRGSDLVVKHAKWV